MKSIRQVLTDMMDSDILLKKIIEDIDDEMRKTKACLVEDYFKVKKLAYATGMIEHEDYITNTGEVFDKAYDMEPEQLETEIAYIQAQTSMHIKRIHKLP